MISVLRASYLYTFQSLLYKKETASVTLALISFEELALKRKEEYYI
jgi:hypothetical protein